MKCSSCQNPYHPSTGHAFTEKIVLCGVCAKEFWTWYKARMRSMSHVKKNMKSSFHDNAMKSVRGDK